ncbi:molybdopterin molybdotransferase MoeA [Williamsia sterculiae]|nr:gephyrin-like molybdotransferase Glp [Williamsia sterculiae]
MRTVSEHQHVVAGLFPPPRAEVVPLAAALGRITAADVRATVDLPGFDNSAMDGYAVRAVDIAAAAEDSPVTLPVSADIPAGRTDPLYLDPGTAHRIMTGSPLPSGADAVVPVEQTDAGLQSVAVHASVAQGASVRTAGSDIVVGDLAIPAGTVLHAPAIGLLAALGLPGVEVLAPVRVVVVSTGSELVAAGQPLRHGQIYESNGVMLTSALSEAGAIARQEHFVPDDVAQFRERLDAIITDERGCDLIVTSGGVSAGAYEVVKDALAGDGVEFVKVAMQPGMPQGCGRIRGPDGQSVPIVTLPGNPVSAQVSFEVFLRAPLRRAMGLADDRERTTAELTAPLHSPAGKRQFRRGIIRIEDGRVVVDPIGPPSSHHLRYLAAANALIDVGTDTENLARGDLAEVILIDDGSA